MKNELLLVFICLYACAGLATASEPIRYVEFASAYGAIRYFSPNPYTPVVIGYSDTAGRMYVDTLHPYVRRLRRRNVNNRQSNDLRTEYYMSMQHLPT